MIDRKSLWISLSVLSAMVAADVWRLSLLPDWHDVPAEGPGNSYTFPAVRLFIPVLALLFSMGLILSRKWFRSGPEEAVQSWRRWYGRLLLFNTVIAASAQAFVLVRSLGGLQSVDRLAISRVIFVVGGVFMILIGNMNPKMPFLSTRFRPLDRWQWNRYMRFGGKLTVGFGLFMAVGMPLLPMTMIAPVGFGLVLALLAANLWYRAKVKRETPPQS